MPRRKARPRGRRPALSPCMLYYLATGSTDGSVCLWDVRLAPVPAPPWFIDLAEAVAGRRIGTRNETTRVSQATLRMLRDKLSNSTESDFYSRWGRWFFQERLKDNPAAFAP